MKYGMLNYIENEYDFNVGDHIQSLAAKQYFPHIDELVYRDNLRGYKGDNLNMIMNGWYTHNYKNWLPNDNVNPLFVSFHLNSQIYKEFLTPDVVNYLKKNEPIGCRDNTTVNHLQEFGVKAYYTGCLTLTLDNYKVDDKERTDDIYIVDPFFNFPTINSMTKNPKHLVRSIINKDFLKLSKKNKLMKKVFDKELLEKAKYQAHVLPAKIYTDEEKFALGEELLNKYARAKLVITSRIHCALPCLAMGTPVIFLNSFDNEIDTCRFDGLTHLFNTIQFNSKGDFTSNIDFEGKINKEIVLKNPDAYKELADNIRKTCDEFSSRIKSNI